MDDAAVVKAMAEAIRKTFDRFGLSVAWELKEACAQAAFETAKAEITSLRAERNTAYAAGWDTAHEPAKCGHARANWKDQKFGTSEYDGDERCEICAEIDTFRAAACQDAEEKAWLREALTLALKEIKNHNSDYHHHTFDSTIQRIEAALACRAQGEKS